MFENIYDAEIFSDYQPWHFKPKGDLDTSRALVDYVKEEFPPDLLYNCVSKATHENILKHNDKPLTDLSPLTYVVRNVHPDTSLRTLM